MIYSIRLFDWSIQGQILEILVTIEAWALDLLEFDGLSIAKFEGFEERHTMGDLYDN